MKKAICFILTCAMLLCPLVGCSNNASGSSASTAPAEKVQTKYITLASSPASAAIYPFFVAVGDVINKNLPQYQVTVSESRGASDACNRIRVGEADLGTASASSDYDNYFGNNTFAEKGPNKDARILWYYQNATCYSFMVAKDSGIASFKDLAGKKISSGGTGLAVATMTLGIFDLLGIENVEWFEAGKADAGDAFANGQIIGLPSGSGAPPESFIVQTNASRAVDLISFTDEELDKIIEKYPYFSKKTIPANTYDFITHDVNTFTIGAGGLQSSTALSQEDGYNFVKALVETDPETWLAAVPTARGVDTIQLTIDSCATMLHAGFVQYAIEKGYTIPDNLIPPEYIPAK